MKKWTEMETTDFTTDPTPIQGSLFAEPDPCGTPDLFEDQPQPDVETAELSPLHWRDLLPANCPTESLGELAYLYFEDKESLQMIVEELTRRGIDPFA